jgi:hypothetical protein
MDHKELIALKLQMGINPSTQIAPSILRAMWQQLKLENGDARRNHSGATPHPGPVTTKPIVI